MQEFPSFHAAELTEKNPEQLAALSETEDEEPSDIFVEWPQLITDALKKVLQNLCDLVDHYFEVSVRKYAYYS